jgi:hypothetical protein
MSDQFLKQYYNNIRDTSWPDVECYQDFLQLDVSIQQECKQQHSFAERKQQLSDSDYWRDVMLYGYAHNNLLYVPLAKCASSYFMHVFETQLGWKKTYFRDVDFSSVHAFGLVKDPLARRARSLAQFFVTELGEENAELLLSERFRQTLMTVMVGDFHSMPYSTMFGSYLYKINWIPMDLLSDQEITDTIENFFNITHNTITVNWPTQRINTAPALQSKLYNLLKHTDFLDNGIPHWTQNWVQLTFADDLKFFYNCLDNFDPAWQQIK